MLNSRFGTPVEDLLERWVEREYALEFRQKNGRDATLVALVRNPALTFVPHWSDPFDRRSYYMVAIGDNCDRALASLEGMMRFAMRTGLESSSALSRPDLIEPGDFPHEGAGHYQGYFGGVFSPCNGSNWWRFQQIVNQIMELRAAAVEPVLAAFSKPPIKEQSILQAHTVDLSTPARV